MSEAKVPYLCGGVLLLLLEQTKPSSGSAKDHGQGIPDEHPNWKVLKDLIYVFSGSKNYSAEKDCSEYSHCKIEGSVNVPFDDASLRSAFSNEISTDYAAALVRMKEFIDLRVRPDKHRWLLKALLDIIENDSAIDDDDLFYCKEDGSTLSKSVLLKESSYCMDSFMLGVLHFIIENRHGKNGLGKDTLKAISQNRRNGRKYIGSLGSTIKRSISIYRYSDDKDSHEYEEIKTEMAEGNLNTSETGYESVQAEYVEADEVLTDAPSDRQSQNITIIQNQTNIENNTTNDFKIENSNVTFNL